MAAQFWKVDGRGEVMLWLCPGRQERARQHSPAPGPRAGDTSCTCSKGQVTTWTRFSAPLAGCETLQKWCGGNDTVKDICLIVLKSASQFNRQ